MTSIKRRRVVAGMGAAIAAAAIVLWLGVWLVRLRRTK